MMHDGETAALCPSEASVIVWEAEAVTSLSAIVAAFNARLAEVARKTNAWVFSCGERSNQGAQLAGHARVAYGASL